MEPAAMGRRGAGTVSAPVLRVALVGVNQRGYRSLALDYLEAAIREDLHLTSVATTRMDVDVTTDPWWVVFRLSRFDPAPDVIAMPVFCWTARSCYEIARIAKQAMPGVRIVLGGPEAGPLASSLLAEQPAIDAVVRGEGEFAFTELLHAYLRDGDPAAVPGVSARIDDRVMDGPDRPPLEDMDSIPSPYIGRTHATDGSAYLETFRGCPHRCAYCYEGKGSTRIRSFSWDRITADIDAVANQAGMRSFSFIDPVFNLTAERLGRLADILEPHAKRGIRLHTIEVDIERIDAAAAAHLKRAGVVSVETGPQSVGARALEVCNRALDRDGFAAGVEACKAAGISVECDIIIGLPGDTIDDVIEGVDFAIGLDPGKVQISTLHVLPGTELWQRSAELGLVFDRVPPHEPISTPTLSFADLRRLEEWGAAATAIYRARLDGGSRETT